MPYFLFNLHIRHKNYSGAEKHLKRGALSVARSFILGNRYATDETIEKTLHETCQIIRRWNGCVYFKYQKNSEAYQ